MRGVDMGVDGMYWRRRLTEFYFARLAGVHDLESGRRQ
jgi:methionine synthase II (cobalamin-independent)